MRPNGGDKQRSLLSDCTRDDDTLPTCPHTLYSRTSYKLNTLLHGTLARLLMMMMMMIMTIIVVMIIMIIQILKCSCIL